MGKKIRCPICGDPNCNDISSHAVADDGICTRLTALEAEVKRLRERKVCWVCNGVGQRRGDFDEIVRCGWCNGTGYIESEE